MTLNYMSGIWVAAFLVGGALLMGRLQDVGRQGPLVATVLVGFAGVVMTLRPTIEQNQLFAGLIGLLSGLGAALAYLQVTALGKVGEPEARTVFYFSVGAAVAGAVGMLFTGVTPWRRGRQASVAAADRRAGRPGPAVHDARLQPAAPRWWWPTCSIRASCLPRFYSLLLFGDQIPLIGWAGMGLIIASGVAATVLRSRALPDTAGRRALKPCT